MEFTGVAAVLMFIPLLLTMFLPVGIVVGIALMIRHIWREDAREQERKRKQELRRVLRWELLDNGIPRSQWREYVSEEEWKILSERS